MVCFPQAQHIPSRSLTLFPEHHVPPHLFSEYNTSPHLPITFPPPSHHVPPHLFSEQALEQELETIRRNAGVRMTCFFGKTVVRARPNSPLWRWLMLEYAYQVLVNNFTLSSYESFGLPLEKVVEVAQVYKL